MVDAIGIAMDLVSRQSLVTGKSTRNGIVLVGTQPYEFATFHMGDETTGGFTYSTKGRDLAFVGFGRSHGHSSKVESVGLQSMTSSDTVRSDLDEFPTSGTRRSPISSGTKCPMPSCTDTSQLSKTYPELTAEVLDLAPVVAVTREYLEENGLADRVTATPCDFTSDALPTDADVAIMASNLPQYDREIIAGVVARVHDALLPGGEFHLIGEMSDSDGKGPLGPALWGLAEALSHSTGLAHSVSDCVGYFESAGFENISVHEFIPNTLTRVTGIRS
jgi:hypothetical protein